MAAAAPSPPLIVVGNGRVGSALLRMGSGLPQLVIKSRSKHVGDALAAAGHAAAAAPIVVATTNDALPKARKPGLLVGWSRLKSPCITSHINLAPLPIQPRCRSSQSARPPAAPTWCSPKTACCCRCWSSTGWRATQRRCCTSAQQPTAATPMAARPLCAAGATGGARGWVAAGCVPASDMWNASGQCMATQGHVPFPADALRM